MQKFVTLGVLSALGLGLLTGSARAEVKEMVVWVDGLSCPFCVYGLVKKLKDLKGVGTLRVDLKENQAVIVPQAGKLIPVGELNKAIKSAGFTSRGLQITVTGRLIKAGEAVQLQSSGTEELFALAGSEQEKLVNTRGAWNEQVTVSGNLQEGSPLPTVTVDSFQVK